MRKFCVSFYRVNGKKKLYTALTNVQIEVMELKIAHQLSRIINKRQFFACQTKKLKDETKFNILPSTEDSKPNKQNRKQNKINSQWQKEWTFYTHYCLMIFKICNQLLHLWYLGFERLKYMSKRCDILF